MKHLKNIGISKPTQRKLKKQAVDRDVSYQKHCEDILERQAKENTITFDTIPETPTPETFTTPVAINMNFGSDEPAEVHNLKTGEKTKLIKKIPKLRFETGGDPITKDELKGSFERVESNIYTNHKIWQYRRMVPGSGLTETYYRTKYEAVKDKENSSK